MVYGYCRGENAETINRKKKAIQNAWKDVEVTNFPRFVDEIYVDHGKSGTGYPRTEWNKLIKELQKPTTRNHNQSLYGSWIIGNFVIFYSVLDIPEDDDYYAANLFQRLCVDYQTEIYFVKQPYLNTSMYDGVKKLNNIKSVSEVAWTQVRTVYEIEKNMQINRIKAVERRRQEQIERGEEVHLGRPKDSKRETKASKAAKKYIKEYSRTFGGTLTDNEILTMLLEKDGVSLKRNSIQRYKREIKDAMTTAGKNDKSTE